MGCQNAKPKTMKQLFIDNGGQCKNERENTKQQQKEEDDEQRKINKISELEKSCVGLKIKLSQDFNQLVEIHKNQRFKEKNEEQFSLQLQRKADIFKEMINMADEMQENSYTLFEKDLNQEPKLEEYLANLLWACTKLKLSYLNEFLERVVPFFGDTEIDFNKISPLFKKKINKIT